MKRNSRTSLTERLFERTATCHPSLTGNNLKIRSLENSQSYASPAFTVPENENSVGTLGSYGFGVTAHSWAAAFIGMAEKIIVQNHGRRRRWSPAGKSATKTSTHSR